VTASSAAPVATILGYAAKAEETRQFAVAERLFDRAVEAGGHRGVIARHRIEFLLRRGNLRGAREGIARLRQADPDSVDPWSLEAQALEIEGHRSAAMSVLRSGLALHPQDHQLRQLLVKYLKRDRRHGDAIDALLPALGAIDQSEHAFALIDATARAPVFFAELGEADAYALAMERLFVALEHRLGGLVSAPLRRAIARRVLQIANLRMILFSTMDTGTLMAARAGLVAMAEDPLPPHIPASGRPARDGRIRVGFVMGSVGTDLESEGMLPMFLPVDPTRFFRGVYVVTDSVNVVSDRVRDLVDAYVPLPPTYEAQVAFLREQDLDILFVGNDCSCFYTPLTRLAATRIAPVQITNNVSSVSSFYPTIDAYLIGESFVRGAWTERYREEVITLPGIGFRLDLPSEPEDSTPAPTREGLGIASDSVVFSTGANIHKLVPELVVVWMEILRRVPGSRLMLMPFNRAIDAEGAKAFIAMVNGYAAAVGVTPDRILFLPPLGSRRRFRAVLRLADIFLDSFPFSAGNGTLDAVEERIPVVAVEGRLFRDKLSQGVLDAIGLADWVAPDRTTYVKRAVEIACDPHRRQMMRDVLAEAYRPEHFYSDPAHTQAVEAVYARLAAAAGRG
jgi:predicted O-linked N-acetylglucosamine transferase (SPINDLY family)